MTRVTTQSQSESLESEIQDVFGTLEEAINELYPPLSELVYGQLTQVFTPVRVGVIWAAAGSALDTAELREQRISLASALEMLHLALSIHKLLVADAHLQEMEDAEKSRIGSVILAGDYCFSRSATLAARTNSPQIVKQFANGLKTVSEGRLRRLFRQDEAFQEEQVLVEVGLAAATILTSSDPEWAAIIWELGKRVSLSAIHQHPDRRHLLSLIHQLPPWQQARWQALLDRYSFSNSA
jgi:geranylgeranyl pyrophosphate synthase